jgi:hypothetical protein
MPKAYLFKNDIVLQKVRFNDEELINWAVQKNSIYCGQEKQQMF